ncbi:POTRA domain-containing protein, partial [Vibrio sp. M250220]|uniref:POTRA domain-containing protein n=1 Tax=Vibrio sp. M250220 TaxID=3020894 RepID=UPI002F406FCF
MRYLYVSIRKMRDKLLLILTVFSVPPIAAQAVELPLGPLTSQDIENEQKQRLEQLEQNTSSLQQLVPTPTLPEPKPIESSQCLEIEAIAFQGNTIYDSNTLTDVSGFQSGCIGLNTINDYLRNISNHYIEAGYVTSRAFMTPQDLSSGVLLIVIVEGKVGK